MPDDDESMTREERQALFKEWETDYALRREEDANRRLAPPANGGVERPSAEILPFPANGPPRPWPSDIARAQRQSKPDQPNARAKNTDQDTGHSL